MSHRAGLVLSVLVLVFRCCFGDEPQVTIGQSVIRGQTLTYDGKPYRSFKGIRYATGTTGTNRFKKSVPAELPELTVADKYGNACFAIGITMKDLVYDEDCLFLNVFAPPVSNDKSKAVIIYIHGGGNIFGTPVGREGASLVVNHDVIMVNFNYRLGPMGYLSTEDSAAPGNMGLFDQNLAIKWTKSNIEYFGGDPNRITVMGESAGGKATSTHTISPYSKDLFSRAIMLCGTIYGPSLYAWAPTEAAKEVAKRVSCPTDSSQNMVECLRKVNAQELIDESYNLWPEDNMRSALDFWWGAVRDDDFIPNNVKEGMFEGEVVLSNNNNEGSLYVGLKVPLLKTNDATFPDRVLSEDIFKREFINQSIYQYYLKHPDQKLIDSTYKTYAGQHRSGQVDLKMVMDLYADQQYVYPAYDYLHHKINKGNSYLYYFDRDLKVHKDLQPVMHGAHHTDDLKYILGIYSTDGLSDHQKMIEAKVAQGMQTYVSNFAKTGDPNKPVAPPVTFKPYQDGQAYLRVTGNTDDMAPTSLFDGTQSNLLQERMKVWDEELSPALRRDGSADASTSTVNSFLVFSLAYLTAMLIR